MFLFHLNLQSEKIFKLPNRILSLIYETEKVKLTLVLDWIGIAVDWQQRPGISFDIGTWKSLGLDLKLLGAGGWMLAIFMATESSFLTLTLIFLHLAWDVTEVGCGLLFLRNLPSSTDHHLTICKQFIALNDNMKCCISHRDVGSVD